MARPWVLGEQFATDGSLPPWDGTGVPLPVDANGWPVFPDGGGEPEPITLTLTSDPPPGDLVLDQSVNLTATASTAPAVNMVRFDYRVNGAEWATNNPGGVGGPPGGPYGMSAGQGQLVAGDVLEYRAANPPGPVADDTAATVYSNTITFTMVDPPADDGFDPEAATVAEVQAYLSTHPEQTAFVLDRERAGKARTSLIGA